MSTSKALKRQKEIIEHLTHTYDGPVDPLVCCSRACHMSYHSATNGFTPYEIADALESALTNEGWLVKDPQSFKGAWES
jgi:hypothetical protein